MKKTMLVLIAFVCIVGAASAYTYQSGPEPIFEPTGEWRMEPMNNGGWRIVGDLPTISMPEPAPPAMYGFVNIDGIGQETGAVQVRVSTIVAVGAHDFPVYDAERENVIAVRYATSLRWSDGSSGHWGWEGRPYHEVVADLIALGWAVGEVPEPWRHPLEDQLPVPAGEWR